MLEDITVTVFEETKTRLIDAAEFTLFSLEKGHECPSLRSAAGSTGSDQHTQEATDAMPPVLLA